MTMPRSMPFFLSATNRHLGSSAPSGRFRLLEERGANQRYATFALTQEGVLVDRRQRDSYYGVEGDTLAQRPLLGTTSERDRFTRDGAHLVHRDTGKRLAVRSAADDSVTLSLEDASSADAVSISGASLIADVLANGAQNPVPYPPFSTPGTIAAYAYACQLWGVSDIRAQYVDTSVDLDGYTYLLTDTYFPQDQSEFLQSDWDSVCTTLNAEISAVDNVRTVYANFGNFNTAVFSTNNSVLTSIKTDLVIADTSNYSIWPYELVEGILYAILNLMGPECGFIANVMAAAFDTAMSTGNFSANKIEDEYANLLQDLINQYNAVTKAAASQETTILADWGMTSTVSGYCSAPTGPLYSTATTQADAQTNATNAFAAYALQGFLPQCAQISMNLFNSGTASASNNAEWVQVIDTDVYNLWSVTLDETGNAVPSACMDYVWSVGFREQDFFYGKNGWDIPRNVTGTTVNGWNDTFWTDYDAVLLLLISNDSDQDLTVEASSLATATDQQWLSPQNLQLPANQSTVVSTGYSWGPGINVGFFWSGYASGSVASLQVSMSVNRAEGGTVQVSSPNYLRGFNVSYRTVDPSFLALPSNGLPGLCVISVTWTAS